VNWEVASVSSLHLPFPSLSSLPFLFFVFFLHFFFPLEVEISAREYVGALGASAKIELDAIIA